MSADDPERTQPKDERWEDATAGLFTRPGNLPDARTDLLATTKERIVEAFAAVDRAAEGILEVARADADEHIRDARRRVEQSRQGIDRLSSVTEALLGQADVVRREVEALRAALHGAADQLASELELAEDRQLSVPEPPRSQRAFPPVAPEEPRTPRAEPMRRFRRSESTGLGTDPLEILVLQMLAGGADRKTIETRLEHEFGVENPTEYLESIGVVIRRG